MRHILAAFIVIGIILAGCTTGQEETDHRCDQGGNYCQWQIGNRQAGICCPSVAPYCGAANTNCDVGRCCNSIPLNLQLHPN